MAAACAKALSVAECAILKNHGIVTIGSSLEEAFNRFVTLEHLAQSVICATHLGAKVPTPLKEDVLDIRRFDSKRETYLHSTKNCPRGQCCCSRRLIAGKEKETRAELCTFVKRAYNQNLFTSSSGAFSIRLLSNIDNINGTTSCMKTSFLITPTDVDRSRLALDNICYISDKTDCATTGCMICSGQVEESTKDFYFHPIHKSIKPSHSTGIHSTIYKNHPEINCIIIAQPRYASAFCITGTPFNSTQIPESYLVLGNVNTLPFDSVKNGGIESSRSLKPSEGISSVMIHGFGLLSVGPNPLKTFAQIEVFESMCGVLLTAHSRGGGVEHLNHGQLNELDDLFGKGA